MANLMTFTEQEIKTIEDLKDKSMARAFGRWSAPIQKLFKKVGKKNCLYYDIEGNYVETVGLQHYFFLNGMCIIKPDFVPEPERELMAKSKWIGDKQNGIECRGEDVEGALDEVCLYVNGQCVMHMEAMSEVCYWFGFYIGDHEVHMNISSRSLRAVIDAKVEDWSG